MNSSPVHTFLGQPQTSLEEADLVFVGLPLDVTSSYLKGAARAPDSIFRASLELEEWDIPLGLEPFEHLRQFSTVLELENTWDSIGGDLLRIEDFANGIPDRTLVLGIGGNHSVTPSLVRARMKGPGTVVQIDAHLDLRMSYEGSPHSHACPMRRVFEEGHRLIQIGVRSGDREEIQFVNEHKDRIECYYDHLWNSELEAACLSRLRNLEGPVYLTVDVDGLEAQLCPGTGTPQPGGLSWRTFSKVLEAIFQAKNATLVGADLVECVPMPATALNESVAASILFRIAAHQANRRL